LAGVVGVVLAIPMVVIAKEAASVAADQAASRRAAANVARGPDPPTGSGESGAAGRDEPPAQAQGTA
jgi:hypothetical protein